MEKEFQPIVAEEKRRRRKRTQTVEKTQTGVLNLLKTTFRFNRSKPFYGDLKQTKTEADTLDKSG